MNNWKNIWSNKGNFELVENIDTETMANDEVFYKLKVLMGVTVVDGNGVSCKDFVSQFRRNCSEMSFSTDEVYIPDSFFDVGCGTGAYLYLLENGFNGKSVKIGGCDYSKSYIDIAGKVLKNPKELYVGEAAEIDVDIKYDIVYSRNIFQYFADEDYARIVVERMLEKSKRAIAILDVHDLRMREKFLEYRRSKIEDYDKKYANTPHLFLPKSFFIKIAEDYNCDLKFVHSTLNGY